MPVRLRCQCGQSLTLPEQKAGLQVLCPVCKQAVTIPAASTSGTSDLVAAATSKVQAELVAAIAGEKKTAPASTKKTKTSTKPKPQAPSGPAKERPLPSPAATPPASSARPEPRTPAPRAAAQPPPRKSQPKPPAAAPPAPTANAAAKPTPPPRPVAAKPAPTPPPLPTAKESSLAPVVAIALAPPVAPSPPPAQVEPTTAPAIVTKPVKIDEPERSAVKPSPPPVAPTSSAPAAQPIRGVEHDPAKRLTVYQLGAALAVLALAATYPAFAEIVRHVRDPLSPGIENWAYLLLVLCGVQLSYALYLVQLPDWSSVWVTMIVTAIVATLYAIGMGMSLMARSDNELIATLGLTQLHAGGYLSLWCFLLTMLTALLSYALVRTSVRWHKMFELAMSHAAE